MLASLSNAVDLLVFYRCDYLDPALAWTGVKDSGRGVSLSKFGEYFTWTIRGPQSDIYQDTIS